MNTFMFEGHDTTSNGSHSIDTSIDVLMQVCIRDQLYLPIEKHFVLVILVLNKIFGASLQSKCSTDSKKKNNRLPQMSQVCMHCDFFKLI